MLQLYWVVQFHVRCYNVGLANPIRGRIVIMLSRKEIENALTRWYRAWNEHDLDGVMDLFHEDIVFENWNGATVWGRDNLRRAWASWFAEHGGFSFTGEGTIIDETGQSALYRWKLEWPSPETEFKGRRETRHGVDVLIFKNGKIHEKLTYTKTFIEIDGKRVGLLPGE